jgi:sRNA-binding carbon storage regulator CsrA
MAGQSIMIDDLIEIKVWDISDLSQVVLTLTKRGIVSKLITKRNHWTILATDVHLLYRGPYYANGHVYPNQIKLGIEAPRHYKIYRKEIWENIKNGIT